MGSLVLHVDVDFFVDPIVYQRLDTGPRPNGRRFRADRVEAVHNFAERQCLLDRRRPVPGTTVVHDDETFDVLDGLIRSGRLATPFEMVHVDAHADLGVGEHDRSFERISRDVLFRAPGERTSGLRAGPGALAFGNWLAFGLACRWIDAVTFVRHPSAGDDLHPGYFVEYLPPRWQKRPPIRDLSLRLQPLTREELETRAWQRTGRWGRKLERAPEVLIPARIVERAAFRLDRTPDLVVLCQSPGYSPPSADKLLRALGAYVAPL